MVIRMAQHLCRVDSITSTYTVVIATCPSNRYKEYVRSTSLGHVIHLTISVSIGWTEIICSCIFCRSELLDQQTKKINGYVTLTSQWKKWVFFHFEAYAGHCYYENYHKRPMNNALQKNPKHVCPDRCITLFHAETSLVFRNWIYS
jgi:hypothetical protein